MISPALLLHPDASGRVKAIHSNQCSLDFPLTDRLFPGNDFLGFSTAGCGLLLFISFLLGGTDAGGFGLLRAFVIQLRGFSFPPAGRFGGIEALLLGAEPKLVDAIPLWSGRGGIFGAKPGALGGCGMAVRGLSICKCKPGFCRSGVELDGLLQQHLALGQIGRELRLRKIGSAQSGFN